MVDKGKSKKARSKGLSQRSNQDWISQLPDPLICHILSRLPTKEAVKTSVWSTRWRSLWLWVPKVELISPEFPEFNTFKSFGDRFFDSNRVSCIHNLKLSIDVEKDKDIDDAYLTSWINSAIKRKVQYLDVWCFPDYYIYKIPISLYTCKTLVYLKLSEVVLVEAGFVSLPCLKTINLKYVEYPNDTTFERLISCCPVLEELKISGCVPKVFRVQSLSLKKLKIKLQEYNSCFDVVIDAPLLCYLKIHDDDSKSYLIKNLASNAKLDISLRFGQLVDEASVSSKRNIIRDFLPGISKVGEMIVYPNTFKVFHHYSKLEPLPRFDYMSRLDATLCLSDLKGLPTFLDRCPNLKSLELALDNSYDKIGSRKMKRISFSTVPECLLSSLKSVYIESDNSGNAAEMKLVRYFFENSLILEKLTLGLGFFANKTAIFKKLLKISRRSITCQVAVC